MFLVKRFWIFVKFGNPMAVENYILVITKLEKIEVLFKNKSVGIYESF